MSALDLAVIHQERASVQQNIVNLEAQIGQLNTQLQQLNANLLASRGAVLGFDRLLEVASQVEGDKPAQEAAPVPTVVH